MTFHSRIESSELGLVPLEADYASYRRRVIFQCYKWDPQVGDAGTICDQACVLSAREALRLERLAELLAAETMALERALLERPDLYPELGIHSRLCSLLAGGRNACENSVRVMRFDFHPTVDGWSLSEVNSDVPGGFAEASALPKLAAAYIEGAHPGADVGAMLVAAMTRKLAPGSRIAFVHATSYSDDRQVMQFLADRFAAAGFQCSLAAPDHIRWQVGHAVSIAAGSRGPIDGVVRFFPADWLRHLPESAGWQGYFDNHTLACNPVIAVLTQSKRGPLVWDRLGIPLPTWSALLPETRDPRDVPWRREESWLVKPAFGRVGEGIAWRGGGTAKAWQRAVWNVGLRPRQWVAQRRFASLPLAGRAGARHLCIGVFTVDGKAAGFYGRLSAHSTIEKHAQDIAILVRKEP